jgi:hypothetical protein
MKFPIRRSVDMLPALHEIWSKNGTEVVDIADWQRTIHNQTI